MKQPKKSIHFTSAVWKEGKYHVAQCFNIDVSSFGRTRAEALKNLEEALELYFEDVNPKIIIPIQSPFIVERDLQYA